MKAPHRKRMKSTKHDTNHNVGKTISKNKNLSLKKLFFRKLKVVSVWPISSMLWSHFNVRHVMMRVGLCQTSHRNSVVNHYCYGTKTEGKQQRSKSICSTKKFSTNLKKNILLWLQKAMIWLDHYHLQRNKTTRTTTKLSLSEWYNKIAKEQNLLKKYLFCSRSFQNPSEGNNVICRWVMEEKHATGYCI